MTEKSKRLNKLEFDDKLTNLFESKGYAVDEMISRGAYGQVYKARDLKKKRIIALKVMFIEKMKPKVVGTFLSREIEILRQLAEKPHRFIVYILEVLFARGKLFVFMEYSAEGDLTSYLRKTGPVKEAQAAAWFTQLSSALHFLHIENRIAHRDIKLENVLLFSEQAGNNCLLAKMTDFGFATESWDWNQQKVVLCRTWCGTAPYYCPQILRYIEYNPYAADCYSMGVLLFAMLNDRYPFHFQSTKLQLKEQCDPGFLRTRYRPEVLQFLSMDLADLLTGLLTVDENLRMTIVDVLQHPWIKRFSKQ